MAKNNLNKKGNGNEFVFERLLKSKDYKFSESNATSPSLKIVPPTLKDCSFKPVITE